MRSGSKIILTGLWMLTACNTQDLEGEEENFRNEIMAQADAAGSRVEGLSVTRIDKDRMAGSATLINAEFPDGRIDTHCMAKREADGDYDFSCKPSEQDGLRVNITDYLHSKGYDVSEFVLSKKGSGYAGSVMVGEKGSAAPKVKWNCVITPDPSAKGPEPQFDWKCTP